MGLKDKISSLWTSEDWWAVWLALIIILVAAFGVVTDTVGKIPKMGEWLNNPVASFQSRSYSVPLAAKPDDLVIEGSLKKKLSYDEEKQTLAYKGVLSDSRIEHLKTLSSDAALPGGHRRTGASATLFGKKHITRACVPDGSNWDIERHCNSLHGRRRLRLPGRLCGCLSARGAVESHRRQIFIHSYGLGYAFWALLIGLLISNTIKTPAWLMRGAKTEMYIKTGLVLLGAEILFSKILELGGPGLFVAWLVTPTVVIFMYLFGTKILKIASKQIVIVIAAATSVCGVSAAIATAAACRAKKEELTLAVGLSLLFTVLMMIVMPVGIKAIGMDPIVGAAWIGGTVDATGAVVAAGSMLGASAEQVAAVVKMVQNILIGVVAFCVAVYWVAKVDRDPDAPRPSAMEIWYRFPKFIVGFLAASLIFSFVLVPLYGGVKPVEAAILSPVTKVCRGWLFCLAFLSIGLESNFKELAAQMSGGKPIVLYIVGQSFNLILTVLAAYLAFGGILFDKPIF